MIYEMPYAGRSSGNPMRCWTQVRSKIAEWPGPRLIADTVAGDSHTMAGAANVVKFGLRSMQCCGE